MIIGFSKHSKGGGSGPVNYLTQDTNPDGSARTPLPQVVRGDAQLVRMLIDAVPFERTYTSGVLSFAPGEIITPAMEEAIMDGFERVAFAGLEPDRYSILWVRHRHAGHHELHFVTPRMELASGKSLNIHPPGRVSKTMFDLFRSQVNAEYGLADPDDPARARDVSLPNHIAKLQADASRKGKTLDADIREAITSYVRREVEAGRIEDQAGVVRYLKNAGYEIPREADNYITILHPETQKRLRLKGGLYSRNGFNTREMAAPGVRYGIPDPQRAAALAAQLEPMVAARARFHQLRYGAGDEDRAPDLQQAPGQEVELLSHFIERHLGEEALGPVWQRHRQRTRTAIPEPQRGRGRGGDDRDRATVARRLAAFGKTLQRAGRRHDAAFAELDRASGRLERASGAFGASAAAIDPWEWLRWQFYRGPEREHGHDHGYGMDL
jgi:Relaxase/Mobilisation nuclease domain